MAANIQGRDPLEDGHYPSFIPASILRNEMYSLRSDLDDRTKNFLDDPFIRSSFFSWAHNHSRDIQDNPRLQEMFKYISHPPVKREAATSLISRTNAIATPVLERSKENSDLAERPAISPTTSPPSPSHKEPTIAITREEIISSERFLKIMDRYTEENGIMVSKNGKISSQLTRSQLEEVIITAMKTAKEMRALGQWESAKSFEVAGLTFEVITRKKGSESLTILSSNHKYLGGGISGNVMRAFSISGGQFRAIKEPQKLNPESQESLQKEYVILKHLWPMEGIPRPPRAMHHFSESSRTITGFARLRHEYIEGMAMEQVERSKMPISEKCRIAKQLLTTVMQMHEKGVAHRDIHLGNVMLSGDKVVVIDFGAAALHSETSPEDFYNKDISDTLWLISHLFGSEHPLHNIVEAPGLKEALVLVEKESEKYPVIPKREVETTRRETTSVSIAETSDDTEEIRRSASFLKVMDRYREMDGLMVSKKDNIALNLTKPQLEEALIKALKISKEMRAAGRWETVQSFEVAGHTFEVVTGKSGSDHISIYMKSLSKKLGAGKFGTVQKVFSITGGDFRAEKAGHEFETRSLAKMENEYQVLHHMGPTEGVIHPPKRIHVVSGSSDKPVVLSRISTKLIEGSALSDTIGRLQEEDVSVSLDVARQIIQIMLRLKEKGVAHNDIHSGNIMVNFDSSDNPHVTLIDFGEAMIRTPGLNPIQIKGFHLRDLDQTCGLFKRIFIKGDALYDIGNLAGSLEEALALVDAEIAKSSST